jgi:5''/3''-nucleotidase SurE
MHILVTNDDGIDAPGLAALVEVAQSLGTVIVVAPAAHMSGCSHSATTDRPLRVIDHGLNRYSVNGTPVDCVRLAILSLAPQIGLVLSGINDGGNLGVDVLMSGTVAGAREALLLGRSAVAISQYRRRGQRPDWPRTMQFTATVLADLSRQSDTVACWNVNLPDVNCATMPAIVRCPFDPHALPIAYQPLGDTFVYASDYHARMHDPKTDVDVCFGGSISVTELRLPWDAPHTR